MDSATTALAIATRVFRATIAKSWSAGWIVLFTENVWMANVCAVKGGWDLIALFTHAQTAALVMVFASTPLASVTLDSTV